MKTARRTRKTVQDEAGHKPRAEPHRFFFPAAMLHASIVLPLAVVAMATGVPTALANGPAHGTEMLAGFALAVIAGFLLPFMSPARLWLLLGLWVVGRITALVGLPTVWAALPSVLFALIMAALIAPRLTRAAKKLRNRTTGPLVALIATAVSFAVVLLYGGLRGDARIVLYVAITLLAALMLFMGGRIIAATSAGIVRKQGGQVLVRVQPRLEGTMLLCFIVAVIGVCAAPLHPLAAMGSVAAGLVGFVRLARWRLWRCRRRPDVWGLGVGYAWVCAGLLLLGSYWLAGAPTSLLGLHCITVGGLGTLSLNVMARTWLLRKKIEPAHVHRLVAGTVLISLAAISRVCAIESSLFTLNELAAALWSLGFLTALSALLAYPAKRAATAQTRQLELR